MRRRRRRSPILGALLALVTCVPPSARAESWEPERQLSATSSYFYGLAASGTVVHFVVGSDPIRYKRSLDEGVTWSRDTTLASSGETHLTDPIAVSGSNVFVIYLKDRWSAADWCCTRTLGDIYLKRSTDNGASWQPEQRLTTGAGAFRLSMAAVGARVHVVWSDYRSGKWKLYYLRSEDNGVTWDPEVSLVPNGSGAAEVNRPQLAAAADTVHVTWMDTRDGQPACYTMPNCSEVYYKRSVDGGLTWGPDVRLTTDAPFSGRPEIGLVDAAVLVAFDEDRDDNGGHEQHVLRSTDGGVSWGPSTRLSFGVGDSSHDMIATRGNEAHLVYFDTRSGRHNIYYTWTDDGGASWAPEVAISNPNGDTMVPMVALSANYVHAVWEDAGTMRYRRRPIAEVAGDPSHLLTGRALSVTDTTGAPEKRRIVLRSADGDRLTLPAPGSADDPTLGGGVLQIANPTTGRAAEVMLPAAGWEALGQPAGAKGYRYRDGGNLNGPCRQVDIRRNRKLEVKCRGGMIGFALDDSPQRALALTLQLGAAQRFRYCLLFGGEVLRDTAAAAGASGQFRARNAPRPAQCPQAPSAPSP